MLVPRLLLISIAFLALAADDAPIGRDYANLRPAQKRLLDDLVARYSRTVGQKLDPATAYNTSSEPQRTTFDAVTHALLTTKLTAPDGKSLGNALDLIDAVEEIAGERPGESGDHQFRVYFFLKPNAFEILDQSKEFQRGPDNSVFHKGYPICFRMERTPSIQFSISADHKRADIDVDYRSSKFPAGLVNGHLSASNSDVRAGKNEAKHNSRWAGLVAWWTSLFSANEPAAPAASPPLYSKRIPQIPPKGSGKIEDAVDDFYRQWLVAGEFGNAASYFSRDSYACVAKDAAKRKENIERGMTRAYVSRRLAAFVQAKGPGKPMDGYIQAATPWNSVIQPINHPNSSAYLLARVPNGYPTGFDCDGDLDNNLGKGEAYASAFTLPLPSGGSALNGFLWQKDGGSWRIVSIALLNSDTSMKEFRAKLDRISEAKATTIEVDGDPDFIRAATDFADAWWIRRDFNKALSYLSPESYGCADQDTDAKVPSSQAGRKKFIVDGMQAAVRAVSGKPSTLPDVIAAPDPAQDGTRVVTHPNAKALLLLSIPDQIEPLLVCGKRFTTVGISKKLGTERTFGKIYVSALQLKTEGHPSVLYLAWKKAAAGWRVFFWQVETP